MARVETFLAAEWEFIYKERKCTPMWWAAWQHKVEPCDSYLRVLRVTPLPTTWAGAQPPPQVPHTPPHTARLPKALEGWSDHILGVLSPLHHVGLCLLVWVCQVSHVPPRPSSLSQPVYLADTLTILMLILRRNLTNLGNGDVGKVRSSGGISRLTLKDLD